MTIWTLIRRSLRFHARAHIGVVLGAAVGSAALVGALVVGDSVRGSLRERGAPRMDSCGDGFGRSLDPANILQWNFLTRLHQQRGKGSLRPAECGFCCAENFRHNISRG